MTSLPTPQETTPYPIPQRHQEHTGRATQAKASGHCFNSNCRLPPFQEQELWVGFIKGTKVLKINTLSIINGMEIGANKSKEDEVEEKPVNFLLIALISINVKGTETLKVSYSHRMPGRKKSLLGKMQRNLSLISQNVLARNRKPAAKFNSKNRNWLL